MVATKLTNLIKMIISNLYFIKKRHIFTDEKKPNYPL